MIYEMRRRKPEPILLLTQGIFKPHTGIVWEELAFADAVSYAQRGKGLQHVKCYSSEQDSRPSPHGHLPYVLTNWAISPPQHTYSHVHKHTQISINTITHKDKLINIYANKNKPKHKHIHKYKLININTNTYNHVHIHAHKYLSTYIVPVYSLYTECSVSCILDVYPYHPSLSCFQYGGRIFEL